MGEHPKTPATGPGTPTGPASFFAAAAALAAIDDAVRAARITAPAGPGTPADGPQPALAALVLLRELRTELAGWEAGLVETARAEGATWADLAHPMGVASRQAAENRYLRLRPTGHASPEETEPNASRPCATAGPPTAPSPPGPATTPPTCVSSPPRSPPPPDSPPGHAPHSPPSPRPWAPRTRRT